MTVLVTGGTGFVGSHAAAHLVASGRPVRLLVRDPGKVARVPALRGTSGLEVVPGDVTDARSVDRALADCTHVVHAAAHVSLAERDAGRAEDVNVGGTERVVGGAAARGIPSVHVSSVSVFGIGHDVITVDSPLSDARSSYTHSKVRAERAVRALQDAGAPVAIVYPSGVLGPDAPGLSVNHQALAAWLRTPPRTTSGTSIIDVRDVAIAIGRVVDRPGRWMLGGEFLQWAELHSALPARDGHADPRRADATPDTPIRGTGRRRGQAPDPLRLPADARGDVDRDPLLPVRQPDHARRARPALATRRRHARSIRPVARGGRSRTRRARRRARSLIPSTQSVEPGPRHGYSPWDRYRRAPRTGVGQGAGHGTDGALGDGGAAPTRTSRGPSRRRARAGARHLCRRRPRRARELQSGGSRSAASSSASRPRSAGVRTASTSSPAASTTGSGTSGTTTAGRAGRASAAP